MHVLSELLLSVLITSAWADSESSEEDDLYDSNYRGDVINVAYIDNSFQNRRTFQCQTVKSVFKTGTSGADLSPEDIEVVAAMGDALSTGIGLWGGTGVEFRGAAFTVGGDATIDGLVTFPNVLQQFSPHLEGVSHGMGTADQLPLNQFNVAATGAETDHLDGQASQLIQRIRMAYTGEQLQDKWVLVFITVGTEEMCAKCDEPNMDKLRKAIVKLKRAIPKAFVVVIGPVHVAKSSHLNYNLLKPRCKCLDSLSNAELRRIQRSWTDQLLKLELEFTARSYPNFPLLILPHLTIESRHPEQLFIQGRPLLNRKGHTYAAKWLWNRLIAGPRYNASLVPLSEDSYYCPPLTCPYFRTPANLRKCEIVTLHEFARLQELASTTPTSDTSDKDNRRRHMRDHLVLLIVAPVVLSSSAVIILGTVFYCHGIKATKGRFENIPGV